MSGRYVRPWCVGLLVLVWLLDVFTPQPFIVAILLDVPIAISALALDSRFTRVLVIGAVVADVTAGYLNGMRDGSHWELFAVANRAIAALSFFVVGGLSLATQHAAGSAAEASARAERTALERRVRRAVENVRASVNPELVRRAIVREVRRSLDAEVAILYAFDASGEVTTYSCTSEGDGDVEVSVERPPPATMSFIHRVSDGDQTVVALEGSDALGQLRLETYGARSAVASPLVEHRTSFGVLMILRRDRALQAHADDALAVFADQAAIALAQSRLFAELGERNEELAAAATALRDRGDVIRDIVYALSHDLRTPLAAARMTMEQALAGAYGPLPSAYREILGRTMASNDELSRLAETLLLVSRYESGDQSVRREPVDLERLARDVRSELEPLWLAKSLDVRLQGEAPLVLGDDGELRRAIVNLLANAVMWTPGGGRIDLRFERTESGNIRLAVEDTGYGVPPSERPRLFTRIGAGDKRPGSGSGLGLYLVRRIARSHGGEVTYAPRPEGGSIFSLEIPAANVEAIR